jgi:thiol-activated cytolysin
VYGKTEYIVEKTKRYTGGELRLDHTGAYVAKFYISWDEINYANGSKTIKHVNWGDNGKALTSHYATPIPLRGNVRNINIMEQGKKGLVWEMWRISGNKVGLALVPLRTVHIGGTTLHQTFTMNPAN